MNFDEITNSKTEGEPQYTEKPQAEVKPSVWNRVVRTFVPDDPKEVFEHYLWERWLPKVADGVCDIFADAVYGVFHGISGGKMRDRGGSRRRNGSERSSLNDSSVGVNRKKTISWREYGDIYVKDMWAANQLEQTLRKHVVKYQGRLSMREYFDYWSDYTEGLSVDWTSCSYGWETLDPDDIRAVSRGGGKWGIDMPNPVLIR